MALKFDCGTLAGGAELLTLHGSMTLGRDSQSVEATIEDMIATHRARVVIDLQGVSFIDSAGLGILVSCHGKLAAAGGQLRLAGLNDRILNVLRITKVDSVLHIDRTVADSLRALAS